MHNTNHAGLSARAQQLAHTREEVRLTSGSHILFGRIVAVTDRGVVFLSRGDKRGGEEIYFSRVDDLTPVAELKPGCLRLDPSVRPLWRSPRQLPRWMAGA